VRVSHETCTDARRRDRSELDALDIRPVPDRVWKQVTARDVVGRRDVVELGRRATAQVELRAWETVYNTIRPHQSLGYLTPAEYVASVGVHV